MKDRLYTATTIIRARLLESDEIRRYVGENIFPVVANDNTLGDFIVVRRQRYDRERTKQGINGNLVELSVVIVSESYDRSVEIAKIVDQVLDVDCDNHNSEVYTEADILSVELVGAIEEFEDYKYIQTLDFEIQ